MRRVIMRKVVWHGPAVTSYSHEILKLVCGHERITRCAKRGYKTPTKKGCAQCWWDNEEAKKGYTR